MYRLKSISVLILSSSLYAAAQQAVSQQQTQKASLQPNELMRPLVLAETLPVTAQDSSMLVGPFVCDVDENVYLRKYVLGKALQAPILKVSSKGQEVGSFSIKAADSDLQGGDFSVSSDGELFQGAWVAGKYGNYVVSFRKDGQFKSKIKLDYDFEPSGPFVKFASGEFLAAGFEASRPQSEKDSPHTPFTAVFSGDGKLIKKITFEDDQKITKASESGDPDHSPPGAIGINLAVSYGRAIAASDGNIYLLRRTRPAIIYRISPAGEVLKRITVSSGEPDLLVTTILEYGGTLAVMFKNTGARGPARIKLLDLQTGSEKVSYDVEDTIGSALACYTPQRFTYVTARNKMLAIQHLEPR